MKEIQLSSEYVTRVLDRIYVRNHILSTLYVAYVIYATALFGTFVVVASNYPPNPRSATPPGVEDFTSFSLLFPFVLTVWVIIARKVANRKQEAVVISIIAVVAAIIYFGMAVLSTCGVRWCLSFASLGIFIVQSSLIGVMLGIAKWPDNTQTIRTTSELQYHIDNWRQAIQVLLTGSAAIGIGFFLQTYSQEFVNAKHMFLMFGPLVLGVGGCLIMLGYRIRRLGSKFVEVDNSDR